MVADGFQYQANLPDKFDAQKIFHTPFRDNTGFSYACIGECRLFFESGEQFDFLEATQRITDDLARTPFPNDHLDYFNEIGRRLFRELAFSEGKERSASPLSRGFAASRLVFVGYGNGAPIWTELVFSNTGTRFAPPDGVLNYPLRAFMVFAGSNTVAGNMEVSGELSQPLSIQEASSMVHKYAQTCIENNKSIPDCSSFAGHIHVGTITKEGFAWKIEPKNLKK